MIKFLIRRFVPNYEQVQDKQVRERYAVLAGGLGMCGNAVLFVLKLIIGISMNSISVISDAFNNLSDMGSSVVMIFSAKMSNKRPDKEHPFGHGRVEYLASLAVAVLILVVGVELMKSSVEKIFSPSSLHFNVILVGILLASLLVKVWLFVANRYMGRRIQSGVLLATAKDCLNDVMATGAIVIATIIGHLTKLPLDGYLGAGVALWILWGGIGIIRDVIDNLLGKAPEHELVQKIERLVLAGDGVEGVHDLMVHDYGPGRIFASVHAEVRADADVVYIHEVIDATEQQAMQELGIPLVIHMDPISMNCERTNALKHDVMGVVAALDPACTIHDFRVTDGENRINLIFDLVVPVETTAERRKALTDCICQSLKAQDSRYWCVIQIDNAY